MKIYPVKNQLVMVCLLASFMTITRLLKSSRYWKKKMSGVPGTRWKSKTIHLYTKSSTPNVKMEHWIQLFLHCKFSEALVMTTLFI